MKSLCARLLSALILVGSTYGLEVIESDGRYELRDGESIVGVVWDPVTGSSDYGFNVQGGVDPEFLWSPDGKYLAANGGAARNREVFLYKVDGDGLLAVKPPSLSAENRQPLDKLRGDLVASGTNVVRWTEDNVILLHVWKATRVSSDEQEPGQVEVWFDVKLDGRESEVIGMSTAEPMSQEAQRDLLADSTSNESSAAEFETPDVSNPPLINANQLVGEHVVLGRNPDGSEYKGSIAIKEKGPLLVCQWDINGNMTYGTALLEGMSLGVALEGGVAIYQIVPQDGGFTLLGLWRAEGSDDVSEETILIGTAEGMDSDFRVRDIDGQYQFLRELPDGSQLEGEVRIQGGDIMKEVIWANEDQIIRGEGLLLGDGLSVVSEEGLAVYSITPDNDGNEYFAGHVVDGDGNVMQEALIPQ